MSDIRIFKGDGKRAEDVTGELGDRIEALINLNEALVELMDDREAKLAAAVDWFETIRDRAKGDYMAHTYYLDALAALATIEKSNAP